MNPSPFPDNQPPLVLNYRTLKASHFITWAWLGLAVLCLLLIRSEGLVFGSLRFHTLMIASLFCVILSFYNFNSNGGPFISFFEDHLLINHSLVHKITVYYRDITRINIAHEEIEFILRKKPPVVINLGILSFDDQEHCLIAVNRVFASIVEAGTPTEGNTGIKQTEPSSSTNKKPLDLELDDLAIDELDIDENPNQSRHQK